MQHGDARKGLQLSSGQQDLALSAEAVPRHRQSKQEQLLREFEPATDQANRPYLLLVDEPQQHGRGA